MESSDMEFPGSYKANYRAMNVKSGKSRVVTDRTFLSRLAFLECLNKWNRSGGGNWLYFEEPF